MIVVRVQVNVNPEKRAEFLTAITRDVAPTRQMPGCVSYNWSEDTLESNHFALYEEWDSAQDLANYKHSEHFAQIGKSLLPQLVENPQSAYYEGELVEIP